MRQTEFSRVRTIYLQVGSLEDLRNDSRDLVYQFVEVRLVRLIVGLDLLYELTDVRGELFLGVAGRKILEANPLIVVDLLIEAEFL